VVVAGKSYAMVANLLTSILSVYGLMYNLSINK